MITFRPEMVSRTDLASEINRRDLKGRVHASDHVVEIPVRYDGEDLEEVAEMLGITTEEVVRRHTDAEYTVAFTGFAPGFAYLTGGDPGLDVPRRKTPRTRIPAGAVGLAGAFSGIYPQASPGGWQIIGVTPLTDVRPGARSAGAAAAGLSGAVRRSGGRRADAPSSRVPDAGGRTPPGPRSSSAADQAIGGTSSNVLVGRPASAVPGLRPPWPGRSGRVRVGRARPRCLRAANRLVGNAAGMACMEIAYGGFSFEVQGKRGGRRFTGAPCPVDHQDRVRPVVRRAAPIGRSRSTQGDIVTLGAPAGRHALLPRRARRLRGRARARQPSTDTLARLGPPPSPPATCWPITAGHARRHRRPRRDAARRPARRGGHRDARLVMGPRTDWFTAAGVDAFWRQSWTVTPHSDRVGLRLAGDQPLERADPRRTAERRHGARRDPGAAQRPAGAVPRGPPAYRRLSGHRRRRPHHLDRAGQIPIGARVRFNPINRFGDRRRVGSVRATAWRIAAMKKVLIANRGEIAVRIVRACADYGVKSVAVYADADIEALYARMADEAYGLGGASAGRDLPQHRKLLAVAGARGADAVHPGYGFLSETRVCACRDRRRPDLDRAGPAGHRRTGRQGPGAPHRARRRRAAGRRARRAGQRRGGGSRLRRNSTACRSPSRPRSAAAGAG